MNGLTTSEDHACAEVMTEMCGAGRQEIAQ